MNFITQKQLGNKIKKIRRSLDFSQEETAKHLGIYRQSFSQIEKGKRGLDSIELMKLSELFLISVDDLLNNHSEEICAPIKIAKKKSQRKINLNKEKLKNSILYILEKCGGKPNLGETVLYKLLYFIDFDAYELYGNPITGMQYIKLQFGPVPKSADYLPVIKEMIGNDNLKIIHQKYHNKIQKRYIALKEANMSKFSAEELETINKVITRLSDMNAIQIEEYVHNDAPWKAVENKAEIDYELVYYRNLPYAQRDYDEVMQNAAGRDALNELGSISKEEYEYYMNLK